MNNLIKTLCVLAVMTLSSCGQNESNSDGGQTAKPAFAKGADIRSAHIEIPLPVRRWIAQL